MKKTEEIFLELIKVGLWGKTLPIPPLEGGAFNLADIDWEGVYQHAVAQTMVGVVADGMAAVGMKELQVPKEVKLKTLQQVMRIEEGNEKMNALLIQLYKVLRKRGLEPWLLKGQGVGLCYPKPNHRQSGDIDLFFLSTADYEKALELLSPYDPKATVRDELTIDEILVELHPDILARTNRKLKKNFGGWLQEMKTQEGERNVIEGVVLPPVAFNTIYIFIHTMRHYFDGGIGLRQVSDWMRYLHVNKDRIDQQQLAEDLKRLGVMKIWKVFGAMAVDHLGCPADSMPLYDAHYSKEGRVILQYILRSGNFGYYDDRLQNRPKNFYLGKLYSFWGQVRMILRNVWMFPEESLRALPVLIKGGMERVMEK